MSTITKEFIDCLIDYINKKVDYDLASNEEDSEGYTSSAVTERKEMEQAMKELYKFSR